MLSFFQKIIDFGHSGPYAPAKGMLQIQFGADIYLLGLLLDSMLPFNYSWDTSSEGVSSRELVNKMRGLLYSSKGEGFEVASAFTDISTRISEVLAHPFVQSGKELASKWPMYA